MKDIKIIGSATKPFIKGEIKNDLAIIYIYGYAQSGWKATIDNELKPLYDWLKQLPLKCNINVGFWINFIDCESYSLAIIELIAFLEHVMVSQKRHVAVEWFEPGIGFEIGEDFKNYDGGWKIPFNLINKSQPDWMWEEIKAADKGD